MNLNVLLRGQSNAVILGYTEQATRALVNQVQGLLGFDGVNDTVTLRFDWTNQNGSNTAVGGTALIGDWLRPNGSTWQVSTYEQGLLNYINSLSQADKAQPTIVLWLHNEYDSSNPNLDTGTWQSAVRYDAGLVRAAFGSNVPYIFVEPIPYVSGTEAGAQAIRVGMETLSSDGAFNAKMTAATDDLNMDTTVFNAGGHMSTSDATIVSNIAARSIAESFAAYAKPGSVIANNLGNIDDKGPIAVQAAPVGMRQIAVQFQLDNTAGLMPLDADAATGLGWSVRIGSTVLAPASATITGTNTLTLNFASDLPSGARLFYGYGNEQLVGADGRTAHGNGVYDNQGLLARTPAVGLLIGAAAVQFGITRGGTEGVDALAAGPGGDTLIGSKGDDYLVTGAGADTLWFIRGDGRDWVDNFTPGVDRIAFGPGIVSSDIQQAYINVLGVDGLALYYNGLSEVVFLARVSALQPGDIAFSPSAPTPSSLLAGGVGRDTVASAGGDTVMGGKGDDYLVTSSASDVFGFRPGDGMDWVDGFTPGTDKLTFGGGLTAAGISTRQDTLLSTPGLVVSYGANDLVFLAGVTSLQASDITFGSLPIMPSLKSHDFNGDATSDILLRGRGGEVVIWDINAAQITQGKSVAAPGASWNVVGSGDFNGDGKSDILLRGQGGDVVIWTMNDGQIASGAAVANPGTYWSVAGTGDLDGDGKSDVVLRGRGGEVVTWKMDGAQIVSGSTIAGPGSNWNVAGVGDLDGDGKSDIVMRSQAGDVVVWTMNGASITGGTAVANPGSYWNVVATGDFGGNGRTDLVLRGEGGEVVVWEMNGGAITRGAAIAAPGTYWNVAGTGDLNHDGKSDIVVHGNGGEVVAWLMDGTQITSGVALANPGEAWSVIG